MVSGEGPTPSALLGSWAGAGALPQGCAWSKRGCSTCSGLMLGTACPTASGSSPQAQLTPGTGSLQVLLAVLVMLVPPCAVLGPTTLPRGYLLARSSMWGPAEP